MRAKIFFPEPSNRLLYSVASLIKRIVFLPRSLRLNLVKFEGTAQDGMSDFSLNYIGEGESLGYLRNFYFSEIKKENISVIPIWWLRKKIRQLLSSDSFIFIEINRLLSFLIPVGGFLTFPWIRQRVCLDDKHYLQKKRAVEETYGRKVRKNNYRFQTTKDKSLVIKFYDELYVPYIKAKYKNISHLLSIEELQAAVKSGFLLQVFEADLWVSGAICKLKSKEIAALAFGLLPEYHYHLHRGALSSVYYFIFKWAEENSMQTVDLLGSRPHADDGVYEHKRRWGANPSKDIRPHTSIRIFASKQFEIPTILKKQLVWNGNKFIELQKLLELQKCQSILSSERKP